jgi:hypothetical protein
MPLFNAASYAYGFGILFFQERGVGFEIVLKIFCVC